MSIRRWSMFLAAYAAAGLLVIGAALGAEAARPALAVLGVATEQESPERQAQQAGLVHLVQSELASHSAARIVSRGQTARFLDELGMSASQLTEAGTSQRLGQAVSADYLVLVHAEEGAASVAVQRVSDGTEVGRARLEGREPVALAARIAREVERQLTLPAAVAPAAAAGPAPVVAVLDFRSDGPAGEMDQHLADLGDLLAANLTALEVPQVERARLQAVLGEIELSASGMARQANLARLGTLIGAERIVVTSLLASEAGVIVDAQLIEPQTGLVVGACRVQGTVAGLPALVQDLARGLAQAARAPVTQAGQQGLERQRTKSLEAALHAAAGWRLGEESRPREAVTELQQAIYLDPGLAWAWEQLAAQYETLKDYAQWAECARRFFGAAEGKADAATLATMADRLCDAEMWQQHFVEAEAAARRGLHYQETSDGYDNLIRVLVTGDRAPEARRVCEELYRARGGADPLVVDAWEYLVYWLWLPNLPANSRDEVVALQLDTLARALDILDLRDPGRDFAMGARMDDALAEACGLEHDHQLHLTAPLRHGDACLALARKMTGFRDRPWTSGRAWYIVGLIEYRRGHGKEAEAALKQCLTYRSISFDRDVYGNPGTGYGLVHYLLGHTYQDLLKDAQAAADCYRKSLFWLTRASEAADARHQLEVLAAAPAEPTEWRHTLGPAGAPLERAGRGELDTWLQSHGYDLRHQFAEPRTVQRKLEGLQVLMWDGRLSDAPPADELRAYVAWGGSLLILLSGQLYLHAHVPLAVGDPDSLDATPNWLLPAFGMGISPRPVEVSTPGLLSPGPAAARLALSSPQYAGVYFPLEVPSPRAWLRIPRSGGQADTVAAVATVGLGKVAVVSLRDWFAACDLFGPHPEWQSQLLASLLDWLSAPTSGAETEETRSWAAARTALAEPPDLRVAVQEFDRAAAAGGASAADADYRSGCLLMDGLQDLGGAAVRFTRVARSGADPWLVRKASLRLGWLAMQAEQYPDAERFLAQAAGKAPDVLWGQARVALGDLRLAEERPLEAAQEFRQVADAVGHSEERFRALFGLAEALEEQDKPEAAARVWEAVTVEFGRAPLPADLDTRWPDPWSDYFPQEKRQANPTVADAVAAARAEIAAAEEEE